MYPIDECFIVLWLSVHLFCGIGVYPDAPGGDLRYQPASVPIQQHPQLWWRHWRRGMRHAVSPSQHPPGSGFPTYTGKARRSSSWHKVSPTRTASTVMLTSAASSHVVAPRVLVSLPTLALGTEVNEEHVWELVIKFHFLWPYLLSIQIIKATEEPNISHYYKVWLCIYVSFIITQHKQGYNILTIMIITLNIILSYQTAKWHSPTRVQMSNSHFFHRSISTPYNFYISGFSIWLHKKLPI